MTPSMIESMAQDRANRGHGTHAKDLRDCAAALCRQYEEVDRLKHGLQVYEERMMTEAAEAWDRGDQELAKRLRVYAVHLRSVRLG